MLCFFVSDLHGKPHRWNTLFGLIEEEQPKAVFVGGDILPGADSIWRSIDPSYVGFTESVLVPSLLRIRDALGDRYPRIFIIPGNDDRRAEIEEGIAGERHDLWEFIHGRHAVLGDWDVYGYGCVPPTPFRLKDWERYDVSRYVDPGSFAPEEGRHTSAASPEEIRKGTIRDDLEELVGDRPLDRAIMLFHSPPYQTALDRAGLDGRMIDHVPLDVHVGSIAIRRFIERKQPPITLHGHIHESARITGTWKDRMGATHLFSAAHDGGELSLVRFDPAQPELASRKLV